MALFPHLPDAARVWIHPTTEPMANSTQSDLLGRLDSFVETWTSHQQGVEGGATVLYDRFVVLAGARTDGADPSGCAIDDATRAVDRIGEAVEIAWVPSLHVIYRAQDGPIAAVPRSTFQERADAGVVTTETTVFDPSVSTLEELRNGSFEQRAGDSWHARAFSLPVPV